jgi:hypothetical protein
MVYDIPARQHASASAARLAELVSQVSSTDDPEVIAEFEIAVQEAGEYFESTLEDLLIYRSNLLTSCDTIRREIERLKGLVEMRESRAEVLKDAVIHYMMVADKTAVNTDLFTIRLKKNPPKVEVLSEATIPTEYMKEITKVEIKPDKKSIADALKMGIDVPGCALIQTSRIEII